MNLHQPHTDSDDPGFDALVADALSPDLSPAELERRILALTDPAFTALMDQALLAAPAPAGLTDRILAATTPATVGSTALAQENRPVVARIGFQTFRYAAAAAVVLAAGLGVYIASQSQSDTSNPIADSANPTLATSQDDSYPEFASVDEIEGSFAIDGKIDQLDSRISSVDDSFWGGELDAFERQLWDELSGEGSNL